MGKIPNFDRFGALFPHLCPMSVKFGTRERTFWGLYSHISARWAWNLAQGSGPMVRSPVPNFTFIGTMRRGENPIE